MRRELLEKGVPPGLIYAFEGYELDTESYELRSDGASQHVEPQVFDVLVYLISHRGRVVPKDELLAQVWGHSFVSDATLSSRLKAARRAIGDSGQAQALIRTVRGRGYQFVGKVEEGDGGRAGGPAPIALAGEPAVITGRDAELERLAGLLDSSLAGEWRFALVTGEAGVGKTTLVERFAERAAHRDALLVARGRCAESGRAAEPYMPVLEALARACRADGGELVAETLARHAPTWLAQMPGVPQPAATRAAGETAVPARTERMLREMTQALAALSASRPLLLLLDDLHWSDGSTIELLGHVMRRPEPGRLLILGAARPITGGMVDGLRRELRPRGRCAELALSPLTEEDVGSHLLDRYPGAESLAAVVHERTEGNPLFVDCLLRSWVERGVLAAEGAGWEVKADRRDLAVDVPDTLRELLERDLERLTDADRESLEVASVVGAEFSAAAVAAGLDQGPEEVEARCAELARRGRFIRAQSTEEWPDGTVSARFSFVHDLHRQILHESIPAGRRRRLHGAVAARLEAGHGTKARALAARLAAHFVEAGEPAAAVRHLQLAADQALARGAHRNAAQDLATALGIVARTPDLPDRERRELSLQAALAGALVASEGWSSEPAETAYARALELARVSGDDRTVAGLLYELAGLHEYRADYPGSEALLEEALSLEGSDRDDPGLLAAHELMACSLFHQGSFDSALEHAHRGLALPPPQQPHPSLAFSGEDPAVSCADWAALALWHLGHPDQALGQVSAALGLAGAEGREFSLANAHMHAARLHQLRGEPGKARAHAEATVNLAEEQGFAYQAAAGGILRGWALAAEDLADDGLALLRQGLDAHAATGAAMDRPYFLALLAEGLRQAHRPEEALATIDSALDLIGDDRSFFYEAELHRLRGVLALEMDGRGSADTAADDFRRAIGIARSQSARSLELRAALSLAALLRAGGAREEALEALARPCEWFDAETESPDLIRARTLIGELRAGAGVNEGRRA